jgi:hypothetical protein
MPQTYHLELAWQEESLAWPGILSATCHPILAGQEAPPTIAWVSTNPGPSWAHGHVELERPSDGVPVPRRRGTAATMCGGAPTSVKHGIHTPPPQHHYARGCPLSVIEYVVAPHGSRCVVGH